jgi:hypothetical protein
VDLVKQVPLEAMILVDLITFVGSSAVVLLLLPKDPATPSVRKKGLRSHLSDSIQDWKVGARACLNEPRLVRLALMQGLVGVAYGLSSAANKGHYKVALGVNDSKVGIAQTSNRIFQFVAALFMAFAKPKATTALGVGSALMALGYLGMSLLPFWAFLGAYGIQQIGNSLVAPTNRGLVMALAPAEMKGRVAAFRGLVIDLGVLAGNGAALAMILLTERTGLVFFFASLVLVPALILLPNHANSAT